MKPDLSSSFPALLQDFFLKHLTLQKGVSPRTIESYRDAFRLLFTFLQDERRAPPSSLKLTDLDAPLLVTFLDWLEAKRGNSPRTRNARLAALKSFLHYAGGRDVAALAVIQRALAIPTKRHDKPLLGFLSIEETTALLAAPDRTTWVGERDFVLFTTAYNTGARVSELLALNIEDVQLDRSPFVRILGKGRKLRQVPLWKTTATALRRWISRLGSDPLAPVFPNRDRARMTRSNVEKRLRAAQRAASASCESLRARTISPHTLRHTTAMHLLQSGVELATIALWLGHASIVTTHGYIEADLAMKERALARLDPPRTKPRRFKANDRLLEFLSGL